MYFQKPSECWAPQFAALRNRSCWSALEDDEEDGRSAVWHVRLLRGTSGASCFLHFLLCFLYNIPLFSPASVSSFVRLPVFGSVSALLFLPPFVRAALLWQIFKSVDLFDGAVSSLYYGSQKLSWVIAFQAVEIFMSWLLLAIVIILTVTL